MGNTRLTALFAVLLVVLGLLATGCGGGGSSTGSGGGTTENNAGGAGGEESGGGEKLTVGSDIPYPPYEQKDKDGGYTGFDVNLMEAIGEEIGREPEFVDSTFETIFRDLAQGKFEAVMSDVTITPERENVVAFSNPYYLSEQGVVVPEGSPIRTLAELEGKTVGVQQGSTGQMLAKEEIGGAEIRPYPEADDAINALRAGTVDGVVTDSPVAEISVEQLGGIEIVEKLSAVEASGIAVAMENTELLEQINDGLAKTLENGKYTKIYEKWFHEAPPKRIFSLGAGSE